MQTVGTPYIHTYIHICVCKSTLQRRSVLLQKCKQTSKLSTQNNGFQMPFIFLREEGTAPSFPNRALGTPFWPQRPPWTARAFLPQPFKWRMRLVLSWLGFVWLGITTSLVIKITLSSTMTVTSNGVKQGDGRTAGQKKGRVLMSEGLNPPFFIIKIHITTAFKRGAFLISHQASTPMITDGQLKLSNDLWCLTAIRMCPAAEMEGGLRATLDRLRASLASARADSPPLILSHRDCWNPFRVFMMYLLCCAHLCLITSNYCQWRVDPSSWVEILGLR